MQGGNPRAGTAAAADAAISLFAHSKNDCRFANAAIRADSPRRDLALCIG
jgi:hypothetical protein